MEGQRIAGGEQPWASPLSRQQPPVYPGQLGHQGQGDPRRNDAVSTGTAPTGPSTPCSPRLAPNLDQSALRIDRAENGCCSRAVPQASVQRKSENLAEARSIPSGFDPLAHSVNLETQLHHPVSWPILIIAIPFLRLLRVRHRSPR